MKVSSVKSNLRCTLYFSHPTRLLKIRVDNIFHTPWDCLKMVTESVDSASTSKPLNKCFTNSWHLTFSDWTRWLPAFLSPCSRLGTCVHMNLHTHVYISHTHIYHPLTHKSWYCRPSLKSKYPPHKNNKLSFHTNACSLQFLLLIPGLHTSCPGKRLVEFRHTTSATCNVHAHRLHILRMIKTW